jgi:hypothetical protein
MPRKVHLAGAANKALGEAVLTFAVVFYDLVAAVWREGKSNTKR